MTKLFGVARGTGPMDSSKEEPLCERGSAQVRTIWISVSLFTKVLFVLFRESALKLSYFQSFEQLATLSGNLMPACVT